MATATKTKTNEEIKTITDEKLLKAIEEYQSYKNLIDEAKEQVEALKAIITEAIEASGTNKVIVGEHKLTLSKFTSEKVSASEVKKLISSELFETIVSRSITTRLIVK